MFLWQKEKTIGTLALVGDELTLLVILYFFNLQTIERGLKTSTILSQEVPVLVLCLE
jgi:hypothetical protein